MIDKILVVSLKYNYGNPVRGFSYEWNNVYLGLKNYFKTVDFFDFIEPYRKTGREGMQSLLLDKIKEFQPQVIIYLLYTDEFDMDFIDQTRRYAKTFCLFQDDSWRKDYINTWASHFDAFSTVSLRGLDDYRTRQLGHPIFLPFGVNEKIFLFDQNKQKDIDVSFVGSWHPYREWLIQRVQKTGINVSVYGYGWPNGPIDIAAMVDIFQRSKISLNLSNSAAYDIRYLLSSPRGLINTLRTKKQGEQIKGRHFEISACGACQLSCYVEDLERVLNIGQEIIIYSSPTDIIEKIQYYLKHDEERNVITQQGYERVMKDHTYGHRFDEIFQQLGWRDVNV